MKIKILENIRHGRDEFVKDDERTVPDELGAYFCSAGWAQDLDGNVETAKRNTTNVVLAPDSVTHGHRAGEANG